MCECVGGGTWAGGVIAYGLVMGWGVEVVPGGRGGGLLGEKCS